MLCEALNESQHSTSPASTTASVRYDAQNAFAYQQHLTPELSMHCVPLLWQEADVDALSTASAVSIQIATFYICIDCTAPLWNGHRTNLEGSAL